MLITNAAYPEAGSFRNDPDSYRPDLVIDDLADLPGLIDGTRSP